MVTGLVGHQQKDWIEVNNSADASDRHTGKAVREIYGRLKADEMEVLQWLMDEIREHFGASDRFDPDDPIFKELVKQLAVRVT